MKKQGLPAFNIKNAKIVILGSFPGELSLCVKEYYANTSNQFWELLGIDSKLSYQLKKKALEDKGIGLWDVIKECERDGSLDKNIKNETYNDLTTLKGKKILFNGTKAYNCFLKANKACNYNLGEITKETNLLPSSSRLCAIKDKQKLWTASINNNK